MTPLNLGSLPFFQKSKAVLGEYCRGGGGGDIVVLNGESKGVVNGGSYIEIRSISGPGRCVSS